MAKKKTSKTSHSPSPTKSPHIPTTQEMLYEVRDELKSDTQALRHEMNSKFAKIDSKFAKIDSKFAEMNSQIQELHSEIQSVHSAVHRVALLMEEQNARNKYVLDGYTSLNDRLEEQSQEIAHINKNLGSV